MYAIASRGEKCRVRGECDRDRRVDVCAGEVSGRVDRHHDDQPEHEADADRPERAVVVRVGDDRAAAGEHERERGEAFGGCATPEWEAGVHRYRIVGSIMLGAYPLTCVCQIDICR
jgi:hypothetical protein